MKTVVCWGHRLSEVVFRDNSLLFTPRPDAAWHFSAIPPKLGWKHLGAASSLFGFLSTRIKQITVSERETQACSCSFSGVSERIYTFLPPVTSFVSSFLCIRLDKHTRIMQITALRLCSGGCFLRISRAQHHRVASAPTATGACLC